ncbi:hypothetical protein EVAR_2445_1 [Eumeta japonica]|uniref:Uncharacterized protein n=1 Tax=Eumeta variegata TaxID=151549 RepID=A0A4C1SR91_EUMVA|nr:hypothetical protein EVAR_2445_1 [Eumeta japonica]
MRFETNGGRVIDDTTELNTRAKRPSYDICQRRAHNLKINFHLFAAYPGRACSTMFRCEYGGSKHRAGNYKRSLDITKPQGLVGGESLFLGYSGSRRMAGRRNGRRANLYKCAALSPRPTGHAISQSGHGRRPEKSPIYLTCPELNVSIRAARILPPFVRGGDRRQFGDLEAVFHHGVGRTAIFISLQRSQKTQTKERRKRNCRNLADYGEQRKTNDVIGSLGATDTRPSLPVTIVHG